MKTFFLTLVVLACTVDIALSKDGALETVSKHGQLSVKGVDIVDKNGNKFQMKGMSLFWDVWRPYYYNEAAVKAAKESCHSNIVRAAMAALTDDKLGYMTDPEDSLKRLYAVVDAAIKHDIYVIVDWHDHSANTHTDSALKFFDTVTKKYTNVPNIIYEIFNEPQEVPWSDVKPYHETVIAKIRSNGAKNIIVVGTPKWSAGVDQAAADPIKNQSNVMYTLHFYAGTNKQQLRDTATAALKTGLPIFVTEYGTVNSNATAPINYEETRLWYEWVDEHNISHVNWSLNDKEEGASALVPDTPADKVCQMSYLTETGKLVVAHNMS